MTHEFALVHCIKSILISLWFMLKCMWREILNSLMDALTNNNLLCEFLLETVQVQLPNSSCININLLRYRAYWEQAGSSVLFLSLGSNAIRYFTTYNSTHNLIVSHKKQFFFNCELDLRAHGSPGAKRIDIATRKASPASRSQVDSW